MHRQKRDCRCWSCPRTRGQGNDTVGAMLLRVSRSNFPFRLNPARCDEKLLRVHRQKRDCRCWSCPRTRGQGNDTVGAMLLRVSRSNFPFRLNPARCDEKLLRVHRQKRDCRCWSCPRTRGQGNDTVGAMLLRVSRSNFPCRLNPARCDEKPLRVHTRKQGFAKFRFHFNE